MFGHRYYGSRYFGPQYFGDGDDVVAPPSFNGTISDISATENTGAHAYDLGAYFTGATSYSIAPAIEAGWTFDSNTGELVIDTGAVSVFGPYVVTATNLAGTADSNSFSVTVVAAPVVDQLPEGGGDDAWKYQGPLPKQKDYRPEIDEKRLREREELRKTLERAAGLVEEAQELATEVEAPELAEQAKTLRTEFRALKADVDFSDDIAALDAKVFNAVLQATIDDLIEQVTDLIAEIIEEIANDDA